MYDGSERQGYQAKDGGEEVLIFKETTLSCKQQQAIRVIRHCAEEI